MKNTFRLFLLLTLSLSLFSCQKEPESHTPDNNSAITVADYPQAILGAWSAVVENSYELYTESDGYQEMTYVSQWATELTLTFDEEGLLHYSACVFGVMDEWNDTYSVHGDTLRWDVKDYKILSLTKDELIIEHSVTDRYNNAGGDPVETTATKHYELKRQL